VVSFPFWLMAGMDYMLRSLAFYRSLELASRFPVHLTKQPLVCARHRRIYFLSRRSVDFSFVIDLVDAVDANL
jgi:hypothetical protein